MYMIACSYTFVRFSKHCVLNSYSFGWFLPLEQGEYKVQLSNPIQESQFFSFDTPQKCTMWVKSQKWRKIYGFSCRALWSCAICKVKTKQSLDALANVYVQGSVQYTTDIQFQVIFVFCTLLLYDLLLTSLYLSYD